MAQPSVTTVAPGRFSCMPSRGQVGAPVVPPLDLAQAEPDWRAEEAVAGVLPQSLGVAEEVAALLGQAVERIRELAVEVGVRRDAEPLGLAVDGLGSPDVVGLHVRF